MIYSNIYRKIYPIQRSTDVQLLEEARRLKLAELARKFPSRLSALIIQTMHDNRLVPALNFGSDIEGLKKESNELADKITSCRALTEDDIKSLNAVLVANKYSLLIDILIPPFSHLERIHSEIKKDLQR